VIALLCISIYFYNFVAIVCMYQEKEGLAVNTSESCSLPEFVRKKKCDLGGRNLTILVQGIDGYFRCDVFHCL